MKLVPWLGLIGSVVLTFSAAANDAVPPDCQALFAAHTRRHEANYAPWLLLPLVVQPYHSLHIAVRVNVPKGETVPLERLGLGLDALSVPPAFVHARDQKVFALLAGPKYVLMAAADELAHRYGEANLSFQLVDDPNVRDFVHLPLPSVTENFASPPWREAPLTQNAVLVDVEGGRFAVAFATHHVTPLAARAFEITWLTDESNLTARLRRNERFALEVPGGVVLSGAAYTLMKRLESRPVVPELKTHLPELPDAPDGLDVAERLALDYVDPNSLWSIGAYLRDHGDPKSDYNVRGMLFYIWRALAPQTNPSVIWRRIIATDVKSLLLSDLETVDAARAEALVRLWGDLRSAVHEKLYETPRDFDPRVDQPAPDDALDIVQNLRARYEDDGDPSEIFRKLWREDLDDEAPRFEFPEKTLAHVLYGTNPTAETIVRNAWAEFLKQRQARAAAAAPSRPRKKKAEPIKTAEPQLELSPSEATTVVDTAKPTAAAVPTEPAPSVGDRRETFEGITWPLPDGFDLERFGLDSLLISLRARFGVRLGESGAAQLIFNKLYAADLHESAPDFKFTLYAARSAFYQRRPAHVRDLKSALQRYLDDLRANRALDAFAIEDLDIDHPAFDRSTVESAAPAPAAAEPSSTSPTPEPAMNFDPPPAEPEPPTAASVAVVNEDAPEPAATATHEPASTPALELEPAPAPVEVAAIATTPTAPDRPAEFDAAVRLAREQRAERALQITAILAARLGTSVTALEQNDRVFETLIAWDAAGRTLPATFTAREFAEVALDPSSGAAQKLIELFTDYDRLTADFYKLRVRRVRALARVPAHWSTFVAKTLRRHYGSGDSRVALRRVWRRLLPAVPDEKVDETLRHIGVAADDLDLAPGEAATPDVHARLRATWAAFLNDARKLYAIDVNTFEPPRPSYDLDVYALLRDLAKLVGVNDLDAPGYVQDVFNRFVGKIDPAHRAAARALIAAADLRRDEHERLQHDYFRTRHRIVDLYAAIYLLITGHQVPEPVARPQPAAPAPEPAPAPAPPPPTPSVAAQISTSTPAAIAPSTPAPEATSASAAPSPALIPLAVRAEMKDVLEKLSGVTLSSRRGYGRAFAAIVQRGSFRLLHGEVRVIIDTLDWEDDDYVLVSRGDPAAHVRLRQAWLALRILAGSNVDDAWSTEAIKRDRQKFFEVLRGA